MKSFRLIFLSFLLAAFGLINKSNAVNSSGFLMQDTVQMDKADSLKLKKAADSLSTKSSTDSTKVKRDINLDPPSLSEAVSGRKILWSIIFLFVGFLSIKIVMRVLNFFAEKSTRYRITIKSLLPVIKIVGWGVVVFLIIAVIIDPPPASLIAVSASIGVAVGFASQDILKNIFGGVIILLERPFYVGDKIQIGDQYGEVTEVGLRSTRLVTADDSVVVIPNGDLMSKSISNSNSGEANCQVVAEIYLPIDTDTTHARKIALEVAKVSKYIYIKKPVVVLFFNEVKERRSYLKMRLKAYVFDIRDEFAFKSDMTEIVVREFLKAGIIKKEELF